MPFFLFYQFNGLPLNPPLIRDDFILSPIICNVQVLLNICKLL